MPSKKPMWIRQSDLSQALGALAANTALVIDAVGAPKARCRLAAIDLYLQAKGATLSEMGLLLIGYADGNMTVTEIAEAMAANPLAPREAPAWEQARRPVRIFGKMTVSTTVHGELQGHFKVNLTQEEEIGGNLFAYNFSAAAITTGATLEGHWKAYCIAV